MMTQEYKFELSIIVPTYNSISKMDETIASLTEASSLMDLEVIFVDDGSRDGTFKSLEQIATTKPSWRAEQMPANSGSAAAPRNRGIELARGKYLYFLDSDDVLDAEGLQVALSLAKQWDYDVVRTALTVRFGNGTEKVSDRVPGWGKLGTLESRIRAITKHQSLTCTFLMKSDLLARHKLRFDEQRRIGEDIKFTAAVLARSSSIGLSNEPARVYVRTSTGEESVTQKINSDQFEDFVLSWEDVERELRPIGVSFLKEHGYAAIFYAIKQFVWFKSEDMSEKAFRTFSAFCRRHCEVIDSMPFIPRYREIVDAVLNDDYELFVDSTKLRLLVAGHDLKFLTDLFPFFETVGTVRIDQWNGHTQHDEDKSVELSNWADLVWCEWLLGASVWYSRRVRGDQRLIVRVHRSEMTGNYGISLNEKNVDAFIAVSPHTLGDFSDRYDIAREKFWLIPNAIDTEAYTAPSSDVDRRHSLAMIGILPSLKGFKKAVHLLHELRQVNPNFTLRVFGKRPDELAWLMNIESERKYYQECEELIDDYVLRDAIIYEGWVDTKHALTDIGFVLSLSDYEGQHLAVCEGFAAGAVGLSLNWRGAKENHLKEAVFNDLVSLKDGLLLLASDPVRYNELQARGAEFVKDIYGVDNVHKQLDVLLRSIRA